MLFGIVGPEASVNRVCSELRMAQLPIQTEPLVYESFGEVTDLISHHQSNYQALLFTGQAPYDLAIQKIRPSIPWNFLTTNKLELMYAIFKASRQDGYDISRISHDSYRPDEILTAFREIGFPSDSVTILNAAAVRGAEDYIRQVIAFHREQYRSKRATCCVVGMEQAYRLLKAEGIPAVYVERSHDAIVEAVQKLMLTIYHLQQRDRVAVLAVQITLMNEHLAYTLSPLQLYDFRHQIGCEVYKFAHRIGACVFEVSPFQYYLVSSEHIVSGETAQYQRIALMRNLNRIDIVNHISLGIGLASDTLLAKQSADTGLRKALSAPKTQAFVVENGKQVTGPFFPCADTADAADKDETVDRSLLLLSEKTGIGVQTLGQLETVLRQNDIEVTTASELARLCGIGIRSMNRLLERLEMAGCVQDAGRESRVGRGRPSRLIRLRLEREDDLFAL